MSSGNSWASTIIMVSDFIKTDLVLKKYKINDFSNVNTLELGFCGNILC